MPKNSKVSVIIPCYNDGNRLPTIVDTIFSSHLVNEIIVVDDGSHSSTKKILQQQKNIKLITHPKNLGKAQALKTGILNSKGEIIVFIDSDLANFTQDHLKALISPVVSGKFDMTLSDRENEVFYSKIPRFSLAYTGDRAIRRKLIVDNIDIFDAKGYLVESAMNQRFFDHIKITRVPFIGVCQCSKYEKYGIKGVFDDIKMYINIVRYLGLKNYLHQIHFAYNLSLRQ